MLTFFWKEYLNLFWLVVSLKLSNNNHRFLKSFYTFAGVAKRLWQFFSRQYQVQGLRKNTRTRFKRKYFKLIILNKYLCPVFFKKNENLCLTTSKISHDQTHCNLHYLIRWVQENFYFLSLDFPEVRQGKWHFIYVTFGTGKGILL